MKQEIPGTLMRGWDSNQGGILSARQMENIVAAILLQGKDRQ